mmetsp:Transcript_1554/g.4958  ORF Transcript_1554/g.4958 Transcript_1554/m.4958 type:complete len:147 (-) Transcript_1554:6-446(-)
MDASATTTDLSTASPSIASRVEESVSAGAAAAVALVVISMCVVLCICVAINSIRNRQATLAARIEALAVRKREDDLYAQTVGTPRRRKASRRGGGAESAPPQWSALAVPDDDEDDGEEMLRIRSGDVEWVEQISDSDSSDDIIAAF